MITMNRIETSRQLFLESAKDCYYSLWDLTVLNVLWLLLTIPVVTAPAAMAALFYATNQLGHDQPARADIFFQGFRKYFWVSWRWTLLNLAVIAISIYNFLFYGRFAGGLGAALQGFFLAALFLWMLFQMYVFPMLMEQSQPSLIQAMRNSFILHMSNLGIGIALLLILVLLAALSSLVVIPWVIMTVAISAFLTNRVVMFLIKKRPHKTAEAK